MPTDQSGSTIPDAAVRVDERGGYREILDFFGDGSERLAGCTHLPLDPTASGEAVGVVVCSPLFNEALKNFRREVDLSRALASRGIAVQRFTYRGAGNSDGSPTAITLESLCADTRAAVQHFQEISGVARPAFLGTRFGGLVAAAAVAGFPGSPLALLEPVLAADRFFAEGLRAKVVGDVVQQNRTGGGDEAAPLTRKDILASLESTGYIDVFGYTLGYELYQSASGRTLAGELGDQPRAVLAVQLGAERDFSRDLEAAVTAWREAGFDVELEKAGVTDTWWLSKGGEDMPTEKATRKAGLRDDDVVVGVVQGWLERHARGEAT